MMSEVNVLWSSAWLTLQKTLASSLAVAGPVANGSTLKCPVQARVLPTSSWLMRARSRKAQQLSEII
jgi:hypothetical protein